jgi:N-acetylglutamate synthase-like GNAT family acetyltransferase
VDTPASYQVRRATTDDLEALKVVWAAAALPAAELEKQFTDFQVAESAEGRIVGAIGLQIEGAHGRIYSESFADFALTDTLRPLFWERLERIARSHGLFRLWTAETAPFWKKDAGFSSASAQPPEVFGPAPGPWLALRLRDEAADPNFLEAQFTLFREAERARRETLLQRAAAIKMVGTLIAVVLFLFAMGMLVWFFRHRAQLGPMPR